MLKNTVQELPYLNPLEKYAKEKRWAHLPYELRRGSFDWGHLRNYWTDAGGKALSKSLQAESDTSTHRLVSETDPRLEIMWSQLLVETLPPEKHQALHDSGNALSKALSVQVDNSALSRALKVAKSKKLREQLQEGVLSFHENAGPAFAALLADGSVVAWGDKDSGGATGKKILRRPRLGAGRWRPGLDRAWRASPRI